MNNQLPSEEFHKHAAVQLEILTRNVFSDKKVEFAQEAARDQTTRESVFQYLSSFARWQIALRKSTGIEGLEPYESCIGDIENQLSTENVRLLLEHRIKQVKAQIPVSAQAGTRLSLLGFFGVSAPEYLVESVASASNQQLTVQYEYNGLVKGRELLEFSDV